MPLNEARGGLGRLLRPHQVHPVWVLHVQSGPAQITAPCDRSESADPEGAHRVGRACHVDFAHVMRPERESVGRTSGYPRRAARERDDAVRDKNLARTHRNGSTAFDIRERNPLPDVTHPETGTHHMSRAGVIVAVHHPLLALRRRELTIMADPVPEGNLGATRLAGGQEQQDRRHEHDHGGRKVCEQPVPASKA
jgi:hypothetical protein